MNEEKLNFWDRIFNRYKKTIHNRGTETWSSYSFGKYMASYSRSWIEYKITDRVTGSEMIKREYLN